MQEHETATIIEQLKSPKTVHIAVDAIIAQLRARSLLRAPQNYENELEWIAADVIENFASAAHTCLYCGTTFPSNSDSDLLKSHVRVCLKHPVGALRRMVEDAVSNLYKVRENSGTAQENEKHVQRAITLLQTVL